LKYKAVPILFSGSILAATFGASLGAIVSAATTSSGGLNEGLLIEAKLTQGSQTLAGRVLVEAGRTQWTTIATSGGKSEQAKDASAALKLEARANLVESDVVELETRISGSEEQTAKLIVRLGEPTNITPSQMEGNSTTPTSANAAGAKPTSLDVKVLRVRYSL
jgi:hypothetical protein